MSLLFLVTTYDGSPYIKAIRNTWAKDLPKGVPLLFAVGKPGETARVIDDVLYVDADDGYLTVASKLHKALCYIEKYCEFDHLFVCDDDNYIIVERLLKLDYHSHDAYGSGPVLCCGTHQYHQGGSGYFLSRKSVRAIASYPHDGPILSESLFSDLFMGRILDHFDIPKKFNSFFNWGLAYEEHQPADPSPDNKMVARHKLPTRSLYAHDQIYRPYPIRVAFVLDNWARGGAVVEFENFIRHADPNRFQFVGAAIHTPWKMEHDMKFPVYSVHRDVGKYTDNVHLFWCWELAVSAATENADVILTWGIHYPWYPKSDVPVILMNKGRGDWADSAVAITAPHATHYVANSHGCVESFPENVRDKVKVIYSGVEEDRIRTDLGREGQRREWDLAAEDKVVGFVGRLTRDKGIFELIMAVATLPHGWKLVLAGEFVNETVKAAATELCNTQIPDRFRIVPWKEPVGDILSALDVFVLICANEGFSNALAEAWLAGVPTVYSPTGAVEELVNKYGSLGVCADLSASPAEIGRKIVAATQVDTSLARQVMSQINSVRGAKELGEYIDEVYRSQWHAPPVKVGIVMSTLSTGGAEQITLNALKGCSRNKIAFSLVKVHNPAQPTDHDLLEEMTKYANLYITTEPQFGDRQCNNQRIYIGTNDKDTVEKYLKETKPDVIVTWGVSSLPDLFPHDDMPVVYLSMCNNEWQRERLANCLTLCSAPAAVSKVAARDFEGRTTVEPTVLYNGVSPKRCLPRLGRKGQRELWGVKDDEVLLGFVGRFGHEKDCTSLARALHHLPENYKGVFVGYRDDQFYGDKADLEGVEQRIIKVPPVEDVGDALAAIDVLFNCSEQEGFGMACVEAWYAGRPVVSTKVGIQEELPEECSVIVPYKADGQTLARAVSDALSPAADEMTHKAMRMTWNNFLVHTMCARWTDFLLSVHERRRTALPQDKVKLYATYTESHEPLLGTFLGSIKDDYEVHAEKLEIAGDGNHHSESWFSHNLAKMGKIIQSIDDNLGDVVIWSDVDITFYKPTKEAVLRAIEGRDIVFQADSNVGMNWRLCTGFMAIRCNQKTRNLFMEVVARIRPADGFDDQFALSEILHATHCDVAWSVLPDTFWSWSLITDYVPNDIVLHHTTCSQGTEARTSLEIKRSQMQQVSDHFSPLSKCLLILPTHGMAQYNRWLVSYLPPQLDYVVVDNNGSWPQDVARPPIEIITDEFNLGWVGSCNEAIYRHATKYDSFIICDNDTKPSIGLFHALMRCRLETKAGIVGPMIQGVTDDYKEQRTDCYSARHYIATDKHRRVGSVSKHCFLVGAEVFRSVGFMDEAFTTCSSGAMDDYCVRAKLAGHSIYVTEGGFVEHYHGGSLTIKHQFWHRNGFLVEDAKYWLLNEKYGAHWDALRQSHEPTNMDFVWVFATHIADQFSRQDAEKVIEWCRGLSKSICVSKKYSRLIHVVNWLVRSTHLVGTKEYPPFSVWRSKLTVYPCEPSALKGTADLLVVEDEEDFTAAMSSFRSARVITRFPVPGMTPKHQIPGLYYYEP